MNTDPVRSLRRYVGWLAGVVVLLVVSQVVCWSLLFLGIPQREEIRAKRFVLENPAGAVCAEWGMIGMYPFFRLGGDPGGSGAMLTAGGPPTLTFFGETGTPRIGLSALRNGPRVRLWDVNDNVIWESP